MAEAVDEPFEVPEPVPKAVYWLEESADLPSQPVDKPQESETEVEGTETDTRETPKEPEDVEIPTPPTPLQEQNVSQVISWFEVHDDCVPPSKTTTQLQVLLLKPALR